MVTLKSLKSNVLIPRLEQHLQQWIGTTWLPGTGYLWSIESTYKVETQLFCNQVMEFHVQVWVIPLLLTWNITAGVRTGAERKREREG